MTVDHSLTMVGFEWSPTPAYVPTEEGEDGWCVRNAICELLQWEPGGEEWRQFIEGPGWPDTRRLAGHLGLTPFEFPEDWNKLITCLDHPGAAIFACCGHLLTTIGLASLYPERASQINAAPAPIGRPWSSVT